MNSLNGNSLRSTLCAEVSAELVHETFCRSVDGCKRSWEGTRYLFEKGEEKSLYSKAIVQFVAFSFEKTTLHCRYWWWRLVYAESFEEVRDVSFVPSIKHY